MTIKNQSVNYEALLEQEKHKRELVETSLKQTEEKLKISLELIHEAVNKYEKIYRELISLSPNYNEKLLAEELELVNSLLGDLKVNNKILDDSLEYCFKKLEKVSRSFTVVINQLDANIKNEICIFYLVLRALDTIEDDPKIEVDLKLKLLKEFYLNIGNEEYKHDNIGDEPDYVELLQNYGHVAKVFNKLDSKYQKIITEITKNMADGMSEFIEMKRIKTCLEYDKYCHYVAGLVGIGLTKIFVAAKIEDENVLNLKQANSMGLFLQKTNIIRDYAEDVEKSRLFWPEELCSKYTNDYTEFLKNPCGNAMCLLNQMVNDALLHFKDCVCYLKNLKDISVFKFCAIPQIMALATLELVYDNDQVYSINVKLEKAESMKIFSHCSNYSEFGNLVKQTVNKWNIKLKHKNDDIYFQTKQILDSILTYF